jgi:p-hydroxybenzoate 3-monooxygenase
MPIRAQFRHTNLIARDMDGLVAFYKKNDASLFETYGPTCLRRIWRAQHFSWWMTSMLHVMPDGNAFDHRRQLAELYAVSTSRAGQTYLAENYVGLPFEE